MGQKIRWILGIILLLGGGCSLYVWYQFIRLPSWYTQSPDQTRPEEGVLRQEDFDDPDELAQIKAKLTRKVAAQAPGNQETPGDSETVPPSAGASTPSIQSRSANSSAGNPPRAHQRPVESPSPRLAQGGAATPASPEPRSLTLNAGELNEWVAVAVSESRRAKPVLPAIQGIKTHIDQGQVTSEILVNLAALDSAQLSRGQQQQVEKMLKVLPAIARQNVLITIRGKPQVQGGKLYLPPDSTVALGGVRLTLEELGQTLGLPVHRPLPLNLNLGDFQVEQAQIRDRQVTLSDR
ncbi:hypothetical protein [Lyngbya confervoides]|uniref:DUF881 domain-containing protein n=1 Tax=Lyngbya confervoides BDU141951 TaxID=1574623 RepID=A0ABD4T4F5_9CYAN|nr:hypothetical protein [Lyngbya confervoides]MCM1983536.1 hypothetical protein [Lyngbya confervoides BDU141951]